MTDYLAPNASVTPTQPDAPVEATATIEATPPPLTSIQGVSAESHIADQAVAARNETVRADRFISYAGKEWTLARELNDAGLALAAGMAETGEVQGMYHLVTLLLEPSEGKNFVSEFIKQRGSTAELEAFIKEAVEVIGQRPLDKSPS